VATVMTLKMETAWSSETLVSYLPQHYTTSQPRRTKLEAEQSSDAFNIGKFKKKNLSSSGICFDFRRHLLLLLIPTAQIRYYFNIFSIYGIISADNILRVSRVFNTSCENFMKCNS